MSRLHITYISRLLLVLLYVGWFTELHHFIYERHSQAGSQLGFIDIEHSRHSPTDHAGAKPLLHSECCEKHRLGIHKNICLFMQLSNEKTDFAYDAPVAIYSVEMPFYKSTYTEPFVSSFYINDSLKRAPPAA